MALHHAHSILSQSLRAYDIVGIVGWSGDGVDVTADLTRTCGVFTKEADDANLR